MAERDARRGQWDVRCECRVRRPRCTPGSRRVPAVADRLPLAGRPRPHPGVRGVRGPGRRPWLAQRVRRDGRAAGDERHRCGAGGECYGCGRRSSGGWASPEEERVGSAWSGGRCCRGGGGGCGVGGGRDRGLRRLGRALGRWGAIDGGGVGDTREEPAATDSSDPTGTGPAVAAPATSPGSAQGVPGDSTPDTPSTAPAASASPAPAAASPTTAATGDSDPGNSGNNPGRGKDGTKGPK